MDSVSFCPSNSVTKEWIRRQEEELGVDRVGGGDKPVRIKHVELHKRWVQHLCVLYLRRAVMSEELSNGGGYLTLSCFH